MVKTSSIVCCLVILACALVSSVISNGILSSNDALADQLVQQQGNKAIWGF